MSSNDDTDFYDRDYTGKSNLLYDTSVNLPYQTLKNLALPIIRRNFHQRRTNTRDITNEEELFESENSNEEQIITNENDFDRRRSVDNDESLRIDNVPPRKLKCEKKIDKSSGNNKSNVNIEKNKRVKCKTNNVNSENWSDGSSNENDNSYKKTNEFSNKKFGNSSNHVTLSYKEPDNSFTVRLNDKETSEVENYINDDWNGKIGGDYNFNHYEYKHSNKFRDNDYSHEKFNDDGPPNSRKINPFDFREIFNKYMSKKSSHKFYSDDGLIEKVKPQSISSLLGNVKRHHTRKKKPKAKEKLIITKGSYNTNFRIEGDKWKDKTPVVLVTDYKNNVKEFEDLDENKQNKCLEKALQSGTIFICYPAENIKLRKDPGESVEVILIKAVLKDLLCEYVDDIFENDSVIQCTEKLGRLLF